MNADLTFEDIARVAHEVNRGYCKSLGDESQFSWEHAPDWQRSSAIAGVRFHVTNPDSKPSDSHESWLSQKRGEGWSFGATKDPDKKEHPCFLPFVELSKEQQAKDFLFLAVVRALEPYLAPAVPQ